MSIWRLAVREIKHRKLNFLLGLLAVTVAVACLVGAQSLLRADQLITARLLETKRSQVQQAVADKQAQVEQAGAELEDAMRKHMLGLGFNVLILPADQSLSELHLNGTLSATMPEEYVNRLAESEIVTVNHLLPSVTRRIHWPEHQIDVIVVGTRGEVPILHRGLKKPLLEEVAPGRIVLGHDIQQQLNVQPGDTVTLRDNEFVVSTVHPQRGSTDDVTVWINLAEAQQMLGMENLINAILALECDCTGDRISVVRQEIAGILPGTQVIERYSQALARAEARTKAKQAADGALEREVSAGQAALDREQTARQQLEQRHARLAALLVPLILAAAAVAIAALTFLNSRQRADEIGILRALGLRSRQILLLFLSKAALIGFAGGVLGALLGLAAGFPLSGAGEQPIPWQQLTGSPDVVAVAATAPLLALLLTGLASWIPVVFAARQDPAMVLQEGTH